MIVVVHGPPGCGKTRNKKAIASAYGCKAIHDGWLPSANTLTELVGDHLVLCTPEQVEELKNRYMRVRGGVRLVPYATAAKRAGVAA